MSSLLVENPGWLTTVQDLGRPGYGALGVSPSGAADPLRYSLGIYSSEIHQVRRRWK